MQTTTEEERANLRIIAAQGSMAHFPHHDAPTWVAAAGLEAVETLRDLGLVVLVTDTVWCVPVYCIGRYGLEELGLTVH